MEQRYYWLGFYVEDRHWIPYQRATEFHARQLAPALLFPPPPGMEHPLGPRFHPPVPPLPRAPVIAPVAGPPGFGPVPVLAPLVPRIIARPPPRVIVPVYHHHHPHPPPPPVQHLIAPVVAPEAPVPIPEEIPDDAAVPVAADDAAVPVAADDAAIPVAEDAEDQFLEDPLDDDDQFLEDPLEAEDDLLGDPLPAVDDVMEDPVDAEGEPDQEVPFIEGEGHVADVEDDFDPDDLVLEIMDGWDDPIIADPIDQDQAQDGDSEITFEDYIPDDPWWEEVNTSASDVQHDD